MKLFINNENIDFTLENEKLLGEVVSNVVSWLNSQGFGVESLTEGETDLMNVADKEWRDKPLESVSEVRFSVRPLAELTVEKLQTLHQYFLLLHKGIEKENLPLLKELAGDFDSIRNQLEQFFSLQKSSSGKNDITLLESLIDESGLHEGTLKNRDAVNQIKKLSGGFLILLEERIRELTQPAKEFKATIELLSKSIEAINEIPVLLQTGKDRDAMATVILFTELSQKLIRLYPILRMSDGFDMNRKLTTGETLEEFYTDFNTILKDLNEAFTAQDSVLIGDLLEYEISPRVENLVTITEHL